MSVAERARFQMASSIIAQLDFVAVVPVLMVIDAAGVVLAGMIGGGDMETSLPFARIANGEVLSPHMMSQSVLVGKQVPTVFVRKILA